VAVFPPQRIFTNLPKEQISQVTKELEESIEVDRSEIGLYRILQQRLSATSISAPGETKQPMGVDLMLREKDEAMRVLWGLVQREYEEINGKQEVIRFLNGLSYYAT
jgi:hypothetical protein